MPVIPPSPPSISSPVVPVVSPRLVGPLYTGPGLVSAGTPDLTFPIKTDVDLILDSIKQIALTIPGERLMEPQFGCNLSKLLFERIDIVFQKMAEQIITSAIATYEPRVQMLSYQFSYDQNYVTITYVCKIIKIGLTVKGQLVLPRQS